MSFFPILSANLYVAHIEMIETISGTTSTGIMNLGSILHDSGGLLSIASNQINCPQGYEYMCLGNFVLSAKTGTTSNDCVISFAINGVGSGIYGRWLIGYTSYNITSTAITFFNTASASVLLDVRDQNASTGFTIAYNSATTTIPNSSITILYKAI